MPRTGRALEVHPVLTTPDVDWNSPPAMVSCCPRTASLGSPTKETAVSRSRLWIPSACRIKSGRNHRHRPSRGTGEAARREALPLGTSRTREQEWTSPVLLSAKETNIVRRCRSDKSLDRRNASRESDVFEGAYIDELTTGDRDCTAGRGTVSQSCWYSDATRPSRRTAFGVVG